MDEVYDRMAELYGGEAYVQSLIEAYAEAFAGSGMTAEEIFEEILCDSVAGINAFGRNKTAQDFQKQVKKAAESGSVRASESRGPPMEGKASRERTSSGMEEQEIRDIQNIGRKSVSQFTAKEMKKAEQLARRYWKEMGTKSPFFRGWFGDWRANDQTIIQVADTKGDNRGVQQNLDTGWDVQVSGKVFQETRNHVGSGNKAARPYLPYMNDIVKKAVLLDSYTMANGKAKSVNSLMMHSMYAMADNGNGPVLIKLYVEEMYDPNRADTAKRAYQLQNIEISSPTGSKGTIGSGVALASLQTADVKSVADLFAKVKKFDNNFQPKQVSKVVNKDSTPKVVYHGTDADFDTFQTRSGVYWFCESEDYAESMMEERGGGKIIPAYLNLRKPYYAKLEPGKFTDPVHEGPIIQKAKAAGYDGVIIESDTTNPIEHDVFYAVFEPAQIKHATENIGTFDKDNPKIRYSREAVGTAKIEKSSKLVRQQLEYWMGKPKMRNGKLARPEDVRRVVREILAEHSTA